MIWSGLSPSSQYEHDCLSEERADVSYQNFRAFVRWSLSTQTEEPASGYTAWKYSSKVGYAFPPHNVPEHAILRSLVGFSQMFLFQTLLIETSIDFLKSFMSGMKIKCTPNTGNDVQGRKYCTSASRNLNKSIQTQQWGLNSCTDKQLCLFEMRHECCSCQRKVLTWLLCSAW